MTDEEAYAEAARRWGGDGRENAVADFGGCGGYLVAGPLVRHGPDANGKESVDVAMGTGASWEEAFANVTTDHGPMEVEAHDPPR
jgi:hypothetical protein